MGEGQSKRNEPLPLSQTHPELAAELVDLSLGDEISAGSTKRSVEWKCPSGLHTYWMPAQRRVKGYGCHFCNNQRVLVGFNDLATTHPDLAAELVDPSIGTMYVAGSRTSTEWRCPRGHVYSARLGHRKKGQGCPTCNGGGRSAPAPEASLAMTHPELAAELANPADGLRVSAGSSRRVRWRCVCGHEWKTTASNRTINGRGCPYCGGSRPWPGETDLATTHPELAAELVDVSVGSKVTAGSSRRVEWRCQHGHEWEASVSARTGGYGCPYCSGRYPIPGETDLATTHPELAAELSDPAVGTTVSAGSQKKLSWTCANGHTWVAVVSSRKKGHGCPDCSNSGFSSVAPAIVYLVVSDDGRYVKFGIANTPTRRLDSHRRQGFGTVRERYEFETGAQAFEVERRIIEHVRERGWRPGVEAGDMPYGGASETLSVDDCGADFSLRPFLEG